MQVGFITVYNLFCFRVVLHQLLPQFVVRIVDSMVSIYNIKTKTSSLIHIDRFIILITICFIVVYVDLGTSSSDTATLAFSFNTASTTATRAWEIKVTQIPCGSTSE